MGAVVNNLEKGGGKTMGVRDVLQGGGTGGNSLQIGDVGDDPLHGTIPGGVSAQGVQTYYREASLASSGRKFGVPSIGGGDSGGMV